MKLWDWAGAAYARPGVEALCLELQDEHGQCVSYLLWAAWAAAEGRAVDSAGLAAAVDTARNWEARVIAPLRTRRRELKGAARAIRDTLKAEELAAERALLEQLEVAAPAPAEASITLQTALHRAAAAWGTNIPTSLLDRLADAFSKG